MAIVIGAGTTVGGAFGNACATSVNWGFNPNAQKLYCLGRVEPHIIIMRPTQTLSVSFYGDSGELTYATEISKAGGCENANALSASVSPGVCPTGGVAGVAGDKWYVTSYSYDKSDANIPGIETWSLQMWIGGDDITLPDLVIRTNADGQATGDAGIVFSTHDASGFSGSVSAGGVGRADAVDYGTVVSVGGSGGGSPGTTGQGSATMSYQDLYYGA